jgi:hypothetical protein
MPRHYTPNAPGFGEILLNTLPQIGEAWGAAYQRKRQEEAAKAQAAEDTRRWGAEQGIREAQLGLAQQAPSMEAKQMGFKSGILGITPTGELRQPPSGANLLPSGEYESYKPMPTGFSGHPTPQPVPDLRGIPQRPMVDPMELERARIEGRMELKQMPAGPTTHISIGGGGGGGAKTPPGKIPGIGPDGKSYFVDPEKVGADGKIIIGPQNTVTTYEAVGQDMYGQPIYRPTVRSMTPGTQAPPEMTKDALDLLDEQLGLKK